MGGIGEFPGTPLFDSKPLKPTVHKTPSRDPSEFSCILPLSRSTINLFAKCSQKSSDKNGEPMFHARPDYMRIQDPAGLIPEDEPVFLLRAQDATAGLLVHMWATMQPPGKAKDLAMEHAQKFYAWPVKKLADVPE